MSKINTVCHKRSSVITEGVPKQPTTDQIDYGEIAINYAANGETLYIKNSENAIAEFKDNKYYQKQLSEYTKKSEIVNSLSSTDGTVPLSAKQGKVLSDKLRTGDLIAKEAKTQWGGRNSNEGNLSPIESLLTDSANRLTFGNAEGVTVEYSTDGGSTWNAYTEETDYGKLLHPIYSGTFCLGGSKSTDRATTLNDMLRITINAKGIGRYLGGIKKMLIYGSTRNS